MVRHAYIEGGLIADVQIRDCGPSEGDVVSSYYEEPFWSHVFREEWAVEEHSMDLIPCHPMRLRQNSLDREIGRCIRLKC